MTTETHTADELGAFSSIGLARRLLLWIASAILICLSAYGFVSNRLFDQVIWADRGLTRFLLLALGFGVAGGIFSWLGPKYFRISLLSLAVFTAWAVDGAGAIASALLCLLAFLSIGDRLLGSERNRFAISYDSAIAIASGAGIFIGLFEYIAPARIHYSFIYLIILAGAVLMDLSGVKHFLGAAKRVAFNSPTTRLEFAVEVAIAFFLYFYLLLVLKPEVGADALAQHLTVPAMIANAHRFTFDFHQFAWVFMPLGGDWLYSLAYVIGAEFAVRLLNFGFLCGITFFVFGLVKESTASRLLALFCALLWLTTPLVELVTGSLFCENIVAFISVASLASVCAFRRTKHIGYLVAFSVLVGAALASKFAAFAFAIPLICFATLSKKNTSVSVMKGRNKLLRAALLLGIAICIGAPTYVRSWYKTGNPVYPFMNSTFKSPYYPQEKIDTRWPGSVDPRTFYGMTYKTGYLEAQKGSFGFEYLLLIPLNLLGFRRSWPFTARIGVAVSTCFFLISLALTAYSRYLYAGLPLVIVGSGALFQDLRSSDKWLFRALLSVGLLCIILNTYFLPASGGYDKEGFLNPLHQEAARSYVAAYAPDRQIVAYLNDKDPGANVAFLAESVVAQLKGTAFTYNWYNHHFFQEIHQCSNAQAVAEHMRRRGIRYFVGHPVEQMPSDSPALKTFVAQYLVPDYVVNGSILYRWEAVPVTCSANQAQCIIPSPKQILTESSNRLRPGNSITAMPNPIISANGSGVAEATIVWTSTSARVEIRVNRRDGGLVAIGGSSGTARTGKWVVNGTTFYLQDHDAKDPTSESATLGVITASVR